MTRFLTTVVACLLLASCTTSSNAEVSGRPPDVVASIFPLFDAATFVGGSELLISNLAPLDPFGPLDDTAAERLRTAKLAIILGNGFQPDVERVAAERSGPTLRVLEAMSSGRPSDERSADPHVWLDPRKMSEIVALVGAALVQLEPDRRAVLEKGIARTTRSLELFDRTFEATFATCARQEFVTTDPRYSHLADRYGLRMIPALDDRALDDAVSENAPTTVFFERLPSLERARSLSDRLGVRVSTLDPLAVQTDQARRGGANYWSVMDINLAALREALDCQKVKVRS